jgi:hypothetical protein
MKKNKQEVITFKADESLLAALRGIPNRSEFIRTAILSSLDKICPTCKGTGSVTFQAPSEGNNSCSISNQLLSGSVRDA